MKTSGMYNAKTGELLRYGAQLDQAFLKWIEIQDPAFFATRYEIYLSELVSKGYAHVDEDNLCRTKLTNS